MRLWILEKMVSSPKMFCSLSLSLLSFHIHTPDRDEAAVFICFFREDGFERESEG